jgi:hypothetical protein
VTAPEPLQSYQPRSTFSTWIGVVLLFAFFGLLALVLFRAAPRGDTYEQKRAKVRLEKLEAAQKQMVTALTTYGWVDKNKGVVRIPITDAMTLTVADLAEKKPAPANPIATPEPAAAPATSPAASPAAAATASPAGSPSPTPAATPTPGTTPKPSSVTGPDSEIRAQPAAAANPPAAPPGTQPGASTTPATTPPSAAEKAQASPSPSPSPSPPGTPLPVRGKTP